MNVKTLLTLIASSFLLSGCFWSSPEPIQVQTVAVDKTPLNLRDPDPLKPRNFKWYVVTPENVDEVFEQLKKEKYDVVLYGLTDDGYEALSLNTAELRAFILHQKEIIKAYKRYYEPSITSSK